MKCPWVLQSTLPTKKAAPNKGSGFSKNVVQRLTLGELETLTSARLTSFLTLFRTWVTAEEASSFQGWTKLNINLQKRASNRQLHRASLTVETTAFGNDAHVVLVHQVCNLERVKNETLQRKSREVLLEGTSVDFDIARTFSEVNASDRRLAASSCSKFSSRCHQIKL